MPFYDIFFRHHPEPMWVYEVDTLRFLDVNQTAISHYGYSEEEFLGMTIADIRPAEDVPDLRRSISPPPPKDRHEYGVWRHLKKNGDLIYVRITTHETQHEGKRAQIVAATDVTDLIEAQQKAEKLLHALGHAKDAAERSMDWFRTLLNSVPAKLVVVSAWEHTCLAASDDFLEAFGLERDAVIGQEVFELYQPNGDDSSSLSGEMRQSLIRVEETLLRDLMPIQYYPLSSAPGAPAYWSASNTPVVSDTGDLEFIIHHIEDVTEIVTTDQSPAMGRDLRDAFPEPKLLPAVLKSNELKTANLRLKEHEANLRMTQRLLLIGNWRLDLTTMRLHWSDNTYDMYGIRPDQFIHDFDGYISLVHPDDRGEMQRKYLAAMTSDSDILEFEHRVIRSDGEVVHVRGTGEIVETASGRVMTGVVRDITEEVRKTAEMKWLNACMSRINDIILITEAEPINSPNGPKIVYANKAFERLTGFSIEEVLGKTPRILQGPLTQRHELDRIRVSLENWQPVRAELINYTKSGAPLVLELDIVPMADASGIYTHWISIERDITERRELEDRVRHSERLDSLGKLTGGIAHDFNNLLTVMMGNSETLARELPEGRQKEMAEMSLAASQKGADLVSRLLAFARRQPLDPSMADLNERLDDSIALLRRTLPGSITLDLVLSPDLGMALVDLVQFDAAILNLCLNAKDAILDHGQITIETANACLDETFADLHPEVRMGEYIMVAVNDTGIGMSREVAEKAFEPFFTTKATGAGTGLGLSMVYGFVHQSGGHVAIYSEPGHGTTIKMFFPRAFPDDVQHNEARPGQSVSLAPIQILVVEDNELVMSHVRRLFSELGFEVLSARTGAEALALLKAQPGIDLLFTDIVLPGSMNGVDIAKAARDIRPELPVLYTTGYTENAIIHKGELDSDVTLLSKPYTKSDLVEKIREVLHKTDK